MKYIALCATHLNARLSWKPGLLRKFIQVWRRVGRRDFRWEFSFFLTMICPAMSSLLIVKNRHKENVSYTTKRRGNSPLTKDLRKRCRMGHLQVPWWLTSIHQIIIVFIFFWLYYLACGILGLQPGIEPGAWRWKHWALTTGQPGKSLDHYLNYTIKICIKYAETPRVPPS